MTLDDDGLSPVLDALTFPAARWEIVTAAEEYGADLRTRAALRELTQRTYFSRSMLVREMAENVGGAPPGPAGPVVSRGGAPATAAPPPHRASLR